MEEKNYSPIKYYKNTLADRHYQNTIDYFDELVKKNNVDVEANQEVVKKVDNLTEQLAISNKKLKGQKIGHGFNIFFIVLSILLSFSAFSELFPPAPKTLTMEIGQPGCIAIACVSLLAFIGLMIIEFLVIKKNIKKCKAIIYNQEMEKQKNINRGYEQMKQLNSSYEERISEMLVEKTMPEITFDKYLSIEKYAYFKHFAGYKYDDVNTTTKNVISGSLFQNPIMFINEKIMKMGTCTYTGSLTITYTETIRTSNGTTTVVRHQTLTASVVKPKPYYYEDELVAHVTNSTPNLVFSREVSGINDLTDKQREKQVKKENKKFAKIEKQALKEGDNFTLMANEEFESVFEALDRNDEKEFRKLFTPLAQTEVLNLLKDRDYAGDIYDMIKNGNLVLIYPRYDKDFSYQDDQERYHDYSLDRARKNFIEYNAVFFYRIFFATALLFAIPDFQNTTKVEFTPDKKEKGFPEEYVESVANKLRKEDPVLFDGPLAKTEAILKSEFLYKKNDFSVYEITSHSFDAINRIEYVPMRGRDGNTHLVPVPWVEYIPCENKQSICLQKEKEDNSHDNFLEKRRLLFTRSRGILGMIMSANLLDELNDFENQVKNNNEDVVFDKIEQTIENLENINQDDVEKDLEKHENLNKDEK